MAKSRKTRYAGPPRPSEKLEIAREAEGKTVDWVDFGAEQTRGRPHVAEGIALHFTDGTALVLTLGSNCKNLHLPNLSLDIDIMPSIEPSK